jgi:hypothetical protein
MLLSGWSVAQGESTLAKCLFLQLSSAVTAEDELRFDHAFNVLVGMKSLEKRLFDRMLAHALPCPRSLQSRVVRSFRSFPTRLNEAVPVLRKIASNVANDYPARVEAVHLLASSRAKDGKTIEVILDCLNRKAPPAPMFVVVNGMLVRVLSSGSDENAELRCAAALAMWKIEHQSETILPALSTLLRSKWPGDTILALEAIGTIGAELKPVFGTRIVELLKSEDQEIREAAMKLLPVFAPSRAVAAELLAQNMLRSGEKHSKFCEDYHAGRTKLTLEQFAFSQRFMASEPALAKNTLAALGADALPEVSKLLASKDAAHRRSGLNILRLMRHHQKLADALKAVPEIEKLLTDPDPDVKSLAEATLKELRAK